MVYERVALSERTDTLTNLPCFNGKWPVQLDVFAVAILSVSLNALAQIALRKTMINLPPFGDLGTLTLMVSIGLNPWFVAGMACYVASIGIWLFVLSKLEVSVAYPLLSIGYIIAAVVGYAFLGENVTTLRVLGILVICLGILLISLSA